MGRKKNGNGDDQVKAITASDGGTMLTGGNGDLTEVVESKADKFRRLANRRLFKAEKALAALANLGNKATYDYTDEQKAIVLRVVDTAFNKIIDAFAEKTAAKASEANYV